MNFVTAQVSPASTMPPPALTAQSKTRSAKTIFRNIVVGLASVLFLSYWALTCLFTFPESSIVIAENYHTYRLFDRFLYQRWNFFAPPPTNNYRVHYIFDFGTTMRDVEILGTLNKKVQEQYLTNDMYANLSWMLFANAEALVTNLVQAKDLIAFKKDCKGDSACMHEQFAEARMASQSCKSMSVLVSHAGRLAQKIKPGAEYNLQVVVATVAIPKYADRYKTVRQKEKPIFVSSYYNSKTKQWSE